MSDHSLLELYNPLYDVHLRQYFALPHMQKHLRNVGLLESTANIPQQVQQETNGSGGDSELYARHHAMMDMMLRNRERALAQLVDLQKKLDAVEKVELYRSIKSGITNVDEWRQAHMSRSLSRPRRGRRGSGNNSRPKRRPLSGDRFQQRDRRYSPSAPVTPEDSELIKRIEAERTAWIPRSIFDRLAANVYRYQYLHKLDDRTLENYKYSLLKQLKKLERFRELSFGPHSVAKHQPQTMQQSWFFRRRSLKSIKKEPHSAGGQVGVRNRPSRSQSPRKRERSSGGGGPSANKPTRPVASTAKGRLPPLPSKSTKPPSPMAATLTANKVTAGAKPPPTAVIRPTARKEREREKEKAKSPVVVSPPLAAGEVAEKPATAAVFMREKENNEKEEEQAKTSANSPAVAAAAAGLAGGAAGLAAGVLLEKAHSAGEENHHPDHSPHSPVELPQASEEEGETNNGPAIARMTTNGEEVMEEEEEEGADEEKPGGGGHTETRPSPVPFLEPEQLIAHHEPAGAGVEPPGEHAEMLGSDEEEEMERSTPTEPIPQRRDEVEEAEVFGNEGEEEENAYESKEARDPHHDDGVEEPEPKPPVSEALFHRASEAEAVPWEGPINVQPPTPVTTTLDDHIGDGEHFNEAQAREENMNERDGEMVDEERASSRYSAGIEPEEAERIRRAVHPNLEAEAPPSESARSLPSSATSNEFAEDVVEEGGRVDEIGSEHSGQEVGYGEGAGEPEEHGEESPRSEPAQVVPSGETHESHGFGAGELEENGYDHDENATRAAGIEGHNGHRGGGDQVLPHGMAATEIEEETFEKHHHAPLGLEIEELPAEGEQQSPPHPRSTERLPSDSRDEQLPSGGGEHAANIAAELKSGSEEPENGTNEHPDHTPPKSPHGEVGGDLPNPLPAHGEEKKEDGEEIHDTAEEEPFERRHHSPLTSDVEDEEMERHGEEVAHDEHDEMSRLSRGSQPAAPATPKSDNHSHHEHSESLVHDQSDIEEPITVRHHTPLSGERQLSHGHAPEDDQQSGAEHDGNSTYTVGGSDDIGGGGDNHNGESNTAEELHDGAGEDTFERRHHSPLTTAAEEVNAGHEKWKKQHSAQHSSMEEGDHSSLVDSSPLPHVHYHPQQQEGSGHRLSIDGEISPQREDKLPEHERRESESASDDGKVTPASSVAAFVSSMAEEALNTLGRVLTPKHDEASKASPDAEPQATLTPKMGEHVPSENGLNGVGNGMTTHEHGHHGSSGEEDDGDSDSVLIHGTDDEGRHEGGNVHLNDVAAGAKQHQHTNSLTASAGEELKEA